MKNQIFAVIAFNLEHNKVKENLLDRLKNYGPVTVFVPDEDTAGKFEGYNCVPCPDIDGKPQIKNYVADYFLKQNLTPNTWLHIIEDDAEIADNGDFLIFIENIEDLMVRTGVDTWMNTSSDGGNYIMDRYEPRIKVMMDIEPFKTLTGGEIWYAINSNPMWMIFRGGIKPERTRFNEEYEFPVFYILDFQSRRRRDPKDEGFPFMNFYFTLKDEEKYIWRGDYPRTEIKKDSSAGKRFKEERKKFDDSGINHPADSDVTMVMEFLFARLGMFHRYMLKQKELLNKVKQVKQEAESKGDSK